MPALKLTPDGRFGLLMFVNPWIGRVSTTVSGEASDGPVLDATIVYVSDVPATTVGCPSVFVTVRPAWEASVSLSVALTAVASEAEAVAVLA